MEFKYLYNSNRPKRMQEGKEKFEKSLKIKSANRVATMIFEFGLCKIYLKSDIDFCDDKSYFAFERFRF